MPKDKDTTTESSTPAVAPKRAGRAESLERGQTFLPGEPEEARAVTGRPPDVAPPNSTFAERAKARGRDKKVRPKDTNAKAEPDEEEADA